MTTTPRLRPSTVKVEAFLQRFTLLHPKSIDLSLGRITRLLDKLGNPQRKLAPVIHIAGTNGKGSTAAYLRAMYQAGGYRVQAYTSPHLVKFNERIRLSDGLIGDAALEALFEECDRLNGGEPITFFEITTAAAFLAFSRDMADVLLLEVGLGGRLDTTNMIETAAVSIITPVSYDHLGFLGDTLTKIAFEKAGILRPGVPAVIGPQEPEAMDVIRAQAAKVGAPLIVPGSGDDATSWHCAVNDSGIRVRHAGRTHDLPLPALQGVHQPMNAAVAITAALQLKPLLQPLSDSAIAEGLRHVVWPARLQRLNPGPLHDLLPPGTELWLDGAHNPGGTTALAHTLGGWAARDAKPLHMVMGVMGTKDAAGTVKPLAGLPKQFYAVTIPGEANGLPAEALAETARAAGLPARAMPSVADALRTIAAETPANARVIICGSLYLAGSVLAENGEAVT